MSEASPSPASRGSARRPWEHSRPPTQSCLTRSTRRRISQAAPRMARPGSRRKRRLPRGRQARPATISRRCGDPRAYPGTAPSPVGRRFPVLRAACQDTALPAGPLAVRGASAAARTAVRRQGRPPRRAGRTRVRPAAARTASTARGQCRRRRPCRNSRPGSTHRSRQAHHSRRGNSRPLPRGSRSQGSRSRGSLTPGSLSRAAFPWAAFPWAAFPWAVLAPSAVFPRAALAPSAAIPGAALPPRAVPHRAAPSAGCPARGFQRAARRRGPPPGPFPGQPDQWGGQPFAPPAPGSASAGSHRVLPVGPALPRAAAGAAAPAAPAAGAAAPAASDAGSRLSSRHRPLAGTGCPSRHRRHFLPGARAGSRPTAPASRGRVPSCRAGSHGASSLNRLAARSRGPGSPRPDRARGQARWLRPSRPRPPCPVPSPPRGQRTRGQSFPSAPRRGPGAPRGHRKILSRPGRTTPGPAVALRAAGSSR